MSTVANSLPRVTSVSIEAGRISAHLADGRIISIPLDWSPRLAAATADQRAHYRIIGNGEGIHWPEVDEDISVEGMLFPGTSLRVRD